MKAAKEKQHPTYKGKGFKGQPKPHQKPRKLEGTGIVFFKCLKAKNCQHGFLYPAKGFVASRPTLKERREVL